FLEQKISHTTEVVCLHEIEALLQINAVNYELRIAAIARPLPVEVNNSSVIINRAFRTDAANDSKNLHVLTAKPSSPRLRRDNLRLVRISSFTHSFDIRHSDFGISEFVFIRGES